MSSKLLAELAPTLIKQAAVKHFGYFQRLMHPVVSSATYINALHSRAISEALDKIARGEIRRLLLTVAPRHFKSYQASVALPAYLLGRDPSLRIICASYGSDLADTFASQTRDIMRSPDYHSLFPQTRLRSKTPPVADLRTTENGYRFATSIGGVLTGKGADIAIIDDPMKAGDLTSESVRDSVGEWFKTSLMTRFDKPSDARVIVTMQRLHMDDLIGRLKADTGWTVLDLPAIAPVSAVLDLGHGKKHLVQPGNILFPEHFDKAALAQLRFDLGEAGYSAQILQRPTPAGGHLFDLSDMLQFDPDEYRDLRQFEATIVSVDCAAAAGISSDYTATTTWGVMGPELFLLHAVRGQWTLPKTLEKIRPIINAAASKNRAIVIESGGAGLPLYQTLLTEGYEQVWTWSPKNNKEARAEMANLRIEQDRILFPSQAPWLEEVKAELAAFPHGKNDDYVDSISQVPWLLEHNLGVRMRLSSYPTPRP